MTDLCAACTLCKAASEDNSKASAKEASEDGETPLQDEEDIMEDPVDSYMHI